jgi:hypothetical protein
MTVSEFALGEYGEYGEYDTEEADAMLDALVEADGEEFTERRRGRGRPSRGRTPSRRPGVAEAQRNGQGVKAINDRINALDSKVDQAVKAIAQDRAAVRRLEKVGKIDGALDLAAAFTLEKTADKTENALRIDFVRVAQGLLKSGVVSPPTGALSNPGLIAGIGFVANNPKILSGVFGQREG